MPQLSKTDTGKLLKAASDGDTGAAARLLPLVYDELRAIAARYMRNERVDHTLQPTALVHEAFLRLVHAEDVGWQGKTHFRAVAAKVMRQLLIDHGRKKQRGKYGGGLHKVTLEESDAAYESRVVELAALQEALGKLASTDPTLGRVVELRFFGGLTVPEVASTLGVSERQVGKLWAHARDLLDRALDEKKG